MIFIRFALWCRNGLRVKIQTILVNGGTGFTVRDTTPEALVPLFDKAIGGMAQLFRYYSLQTIGTLTFNLGR